MEQGSAARKIDGIHAVARESEKSPILQQQEI